MTKLRLNVMNSESETTESSRVESSDYETDTYYYRARYYKLREGSSVKTRWNSRVASISIGTL